MSDINQNRMIPLHIADQAVEACNKEIAELKAEVETLKMERIHDLNQIGGLQQELASLRASSFVTAVPVEEYEKLKAEVERLTADNEQLQNRCDFLEGKPSA